MGRGRFWEGWIYAVWIAMRKYPWLAPGDYNDDGETGARIMRPAEKLAVIEDGQCTPMTLGTLFFVAMMGRCCSIL